MKKDTQEKASIDSLALQNFIKHCLYSLKLKGLSPLDAAGLMTGLDIDCSEDNPDWVDVEYLIYWHLKLNYGEEKTYD